MEILIYRNCEDCSRKDTCTKATTIGCNNFLLYESKDEKENKTKS